MIDIQLQKLGFSEKQVAVLGCLAEHGALAASGISTRCGQPRSTVYTTLDELEKMEVVSHEDNLGIKSYRISSGSSFLALIDRQKDEVIAREKAARQLSVLLEASARDSTSALPKIAFVSGKADIAKWLYERRTAWRESMHRHDATWWGYQDDMFVSQYQDWFEDTWKTTPANENVNLLSNQSELEATLEGVHPGRNIKQVGKIEFFTSTIWVCGEYVIMITTRARPHYAFELHDSIFASNLRGVFSMLWNINK